MSIYNKLLQNMGDKTTAVIPIRKGSTRVTNKNLRVFGNTNLLELKIETLKKVAELNEIVVEVLHLTGR